MALIIVESPTKARTFNRILDSKKHFVYATMGHFRDLPKSKISIDFKNEFKPKYSIIKGKQKIVKQLKELGTKNKEIILATDLDREGESIAYHAAYVLGFINEKWPNFSIKNKKNLKRIIFHEITAKALKNALKKPEELRSDLIKAQQARRILDRVVGYELSPLLWKKMGKNWLSAGRVQTVALRLIVEREKEIKKFKKEFYYQIYGDFKNKHEIKGKLIEKDGKKYETIFKVNLFDGEYSYTKTSIDKKNVNLIKKDLKTDKYHVFKIKETINTKYPPPPHTTSLLQQDAFYRYGFTSKMTMRLAQNLYENGLITYHRTDSFNLSSYFVFRAKDYIAENYGKKYALDKPRGFKTRSKSAQEAHEAIRPTKIDRGIEKLKNYKKLTINHRRLYQLIFNRALATQMKEAKVKQIKVFIKGKKGYLFETDFYHVIFDGFLKVLNPKYVENNSKKIDIKEKEKLVLKTINDEECETKPPLRYNEASLIKSLEAKGIGRPSTYAPIISLIQIKYYVEKEYRYFLPTNLGVAISDYLSKAFPKLFNVGFTAEMEDGLDNIADGGKELTELLNTFYNPFKKELDIKKKDKELINVQEDVKEICPKCKGSMIVRFSKFGKFLACSNYPKCKFTKSFLYLVKDKKCPECGGDIAVRFTKTKKKFYGCSNYPKCKYSAWKLSDVGKKTTKK